MDPIDKLLQAWLERQFPEPKQAESNVVKKPKKSALEALVSNDTSGTNLWV